MELDRAQYYRYPCRVGSSLRYVASANQTKAFGLADARVAKVVGEADQNRARKATEFFEKFAEIHPAQSPRGRWGTLGKALWGTEKDLWNSMNRHAFSLPFHADPDFARGPKREFLGKTRNPVGMIKELLTDGRAVYRIQFMASGCAAPMAQGPAQMARANLPPKEPTHRRSGRGEDRWDRQPSAASRSEPRPAIERTRYFNASSSTRARAGASNRPSPPEVGLEDEGRARGAALVEQGLRALSLLDEGPPSQCETMDRVLAGDSFGMTEPPGREKKRARHWGHDAMGWIAAPKAAGPSDAQTGRRDSLRSRMIADLGQSRRGNRFTAGKKWMSELPAFAPIMTARLTCLSDGRPAHFSAEFLPRAAKKGDRITFFAHSFDHPKVMGEIVGAVERGVKVDLCADAGGLLGGADSRRGIQLTADAVDRSARAPGPGRFRAFAQTRCEMRETHSRYDWSAGNAVLGASRAKAPRAPRNWSASPEGNREISCMLELEGEARLKHVEGFLDEMKAGAREVTSREMRGRPMGKNGRGKPQFARR